MIGIMNVCAGFKLAIASLAAAAIAQAATAAMVPTEAHTGDAVALAMLQNIQANGFDSDPRINGGLGGLWINWRTGSNPLLVNFNGSGAPDKIDPPRHDPLDDFRYLHNLLAWQHRHPQDAQFQGDIRKFSAIVKREYAHSGDQRGWLYDELMDMWHLSGDDFFRETARGLAAHYATHDIHGDIGAIYKTSAAHPNGYYRVDNALEAGCALVMAGVEFQQPDWSAQGGRLVNFVYDHAYLRQAHLFLNQMDNVRLAGGAANSNETIYRERQNYEVNGGVVRFGNIGQEALSLLHAYLVTTNKIYLARANDLLTPLTVGENQLGLWDTQNGGYFYGVEFDGPDFAHPGQPKLLGNKKESGRQFHMLQAFHVADRLTGGKYQDMEAALLRTLLDKAYYAPGRGMVYEMAPDWSLVKVKHDRVEDWVTTEAMGCAMLAIDSINAPEPW